MEAAQKDHKGTQAQLESIASRSVLDSVQSNVINKKGGGAPVDKDPIDWVRNNGEEMIRLEKEEPEEFERIMDLYLKESEKSKEQNYGY